MGSTSLTPAPIEFMMHPTGKPNRRQHWPAHLAAPYTTTITAFGLLLIAFALRTIDLGTRQFAGKDEPFTCSFSFLSFGQILSETFRLREPHPVLSYFAQHAWYLLTGRSEFAMRFLSAAFGLISLALLYRLVKEMWPRPQLQPTHPSQVSRVMLPVLALAVMALNPLGITYDRIMRMYALHVLLTLASTLFMVRLIHDAEQGRRSTRHIAGYVLVSLLALHTHYYAALVLVSQNLFVLALLIFSKAHRSRTLFVRWVAAQVSVAALFAPWLVLVRGILSNYTGFVASPTVPEAFNEWLGSLMVSDLDWTTNGRPTFALLGAAICLVGLIGILRSPQRRWAGLLLSWLLVTPIAVWYAAQNRPIFTARYLIATLPPFAILAAWAVAGLPGLAGLASFARRSANIATRPKSNQAGINMACAGLGLLCSMALGWGMARALVPLFEKASQRDGTWPALVQLIDRYTGTFPAQQERFLLNFPDQAFGCYYNEGALADHAPGKAPFFVMPPFQDDEAGATREVQKMVDEGVRRVVLQRVDSSWDPNRWAEKAVDVDYDQIEEVFSGQWIVKIYARPVLTELRPINVTFGDVVRLDRAAIYPDFNARLIEVNLRWAAGAISLHGSEKIFMHVMRVGDAGTLYGQQDLQLSPEDLGRVRTYGVRLADELPPGDYILRLGIYDPAQPNAPRLPTSEGKDAFEVPLDAGLKVNAN